MLFYVFKGFEKRAAKLVFLFEVYVLLCQNVVSFWQNISMSFYKFARCATYDSGEMSPCGGA